MSKTELYFKKASGRVSSRKNFLAMSSTAFIYLPPLSNGVAMHLENPSTRYEDNETDTKYNGLDVGACFVHQLRQGGHG